MNHARTMKRIRNMLTRFENAARTDEIRGSLHPDIRDDVEYEYHRSRKKLEDVIKEELNNAHNRTD